MKKPNLSLKFPASRRADTKVAFCPPPADATQPAATEYIAIATSRSKR